MDKLFESPCSNSSTFCSEVERIDKTDHKRKAYMHRSPTARKKWTAQTRNIAEFNPTLKQMNPQSKDKDVVNNKFYRKRSFTQDPSATRLTSTYNSGELRHILPTSWGRTFKIPSPKKIHSTQSPNVRSHKINTDAAALNKHYPTNSGCRSGTFTPTDKFHIYPTPNNSQNAKDNFDTMSITSEDVFSTIDREIELHRIRKEVISQQRYKLPVVSSERKTPLCPCIHYHQDNIPKRTSVLSQPKSITHRATQTKSSQETENAFKLTKDQIESIATFLKIKPEKMQLVVENVTKGNEIGEGVSGSDEDDSSDEVIPASQSPVKRRYSCTQTSNSSKVSIVTPHSDNNVI